MTARESLEESLETLRRVGRSALLLVTQQPYSFRSGTFGLTTPRLPLATIAGRN